MTLRRRIMKYIKDKIVSKNTKAKKPFNKLKKLYPYRLSARIKKFMKFLADVTLFILEF